MNLSNCPTTYRENSNVPLNAPTKNE